MTIPRKISETIELLHELLNTGTTDYPKGLRFAGDQNPRAIRDQVGMAYSELKKAQKAEASPLTTTLMNTVTALSKLVSDEAVLAEEYRVETKDARRRALDDLLALARARLEGFRLGMRCTYSEVECANIEILARQP